MTELEAIQHPAGATGMGVPARILPATASVKMYAARCCMQVEIDLTAFSRGARVRLFPYGRPAIT